MKTIKKIVVATVISSLATLKLMSGPAVGITVQVPVPVPPPPPSITVTVGVPDAYVWDGYEYVGVVGTQYFYLGAGDYWLPCDAVRLGHFHEWERAHADWRAHTVVNAHYRVDARGHVHPWHGEKHFDKDDRGHDHNHGH